MRPARRSAASLPCATTSIAAAILNPPFAIHARRAGLEDMGAVVDTIGPYLGTVPYVLRGWAEANAETLAAYLAACIEGLRFALDPANKAAAIRLDCRAADLPADIAAEIFAAAADPAIGLAKDATFDRRGFQDRAAAARRFRGPDAARRRNNISICRFTSGLSLGYKLAIRREQVHEGAMSKKPRVTFKLERVAEGDWQIQAHHPDEPVRFIKASRPRPRSTSG